MKSKLIYTIIFVLSNTLSFCIEMKLIDNTIITTKEKFFGLSTLWSEIKYNFVNIDQIGFDPDSLFMEYIEKIQEVKTDSEYYDLLQGFAACFSDGHTEVVSPFNWNDNYDYVPFIAKKYGEDLYIIKIRKGSLDSTFIKSKILKIENTPPMKWIKDRYFQQISSSNNRNKENISIYKFHGGKKNEVINVTLEKMDGSIHDVPIIRNGEQTRSKDDKYYGISNQIEDSTVTTKWIDKTAIIKIKSFFPEQELINSIDYNINSIISNNPRSIIIDLRDNYGGSSRVGYHLQKYLTQEDMFLTFESETRDNNSYAKSQGNYKIEHKDYYKGIHYTIYPSDTIFITSDFPRIIVPTAILINENCYSACEDFLVGIYETNNRPILIGNETGGSTGAPLVISMPNGGYARICTLRIKFPYSKKLFIKRGIVPDIQIENSIEDDFNKYDSQLNAAIDFLNNSRF